MLGVGVVVDAGRLGEERVDPVAGDDQPGGEVAVGPVGAHAHDAPAVVAQQAGGGGRAHQHRPGIGGLRRQPGVEVGAQRRAPVVGGLAPGRGAEVEGEGLGVGHHHRAAPGDPALHGDLLPPAWDEGVEDAAVHHAAVHVLRARERAPFEQADLLPGSGEHQRRGRAGRTGAHHDHVEVEALGSVDDGHLRRRSGEIPPGGHPAGPWPSSCFGHDVTPSRRASASTSAGASVTRARSAIDIIGQLASVLTAMTWSGDPRPAVCCTAPEMPNAR